jgi:hypothetical protein
VYLVGGWSGVYSGEMDGSRVETTDNSGFRERDVLEGCK